jgi:flagellar motility protein MotE (MotC chaperone)
VIAAGILMLSVRVGDIYEDIDGWVGAVRVGQTQAQAASEPAAEHSSGTPERAGPEAEPTGQMTPSGLPPAATGGAPDIAAEAAAGVTPPGFTQSEINLLQRLAERREELDAMERELTDREALLQAAERRIENRIQELKSLEEMIQGLLAQHSEQEQARIDQLVSIYATMKPSDAARIFNDLDMPILLRVIETMKERSSAAILADMSPERAKEVTTELARRRALPGSDPAATDQEATLQ